MDVKEFEKIKNRIEEFKTEKIQLQTKMDSIEAEWKKEYGFSSKEEAEKKLQEMEEEIEGLTRKMDKLFSQLKELIPAGGI